VIQRSKSTYSNRFVSAWVYALSGDRKMKKLYSLVIVLVGLLALFTVSRLSKAQNTSSADAKSKNQVNETAQGGISRIELEAANAGTGVQKIMYSLNGATFQPYLTPLTLNAATTPIIYAYADNNVFNRSGLVTHNLTASNAGFSVNGPGSSPSGGSITASWNAPVGRPVDDWIGLFRLGTSSDLNEGF
jgi:hypothetical protein